MKRFLPRKPQHWFAVLALLFGLCFTFVTPLLKVPDELGHMARAYGISTGNWLSTVQNNHSGSYLPESLKTVSDYAVSHGTLNTLQNMQSVGLVSGRTFFSEHPNMALYNPLLYAPQATAFIVARTVQLPAVDAMYLARIFNLLAYVALWWVAIRILPFGKWAGVVVGLLPMHVLLAGSMSADPVSIGISAVLVAVVLALRALNRQVTIKEYWWLIGVTAVVSLTKLPFPLLLLLFLFVPTAVLGGNKKAWWRAIGGLALTGAVVGGGWLVLAQHTLVPYGPEGVNTALQAQGLLTHPLDFLRAFAMTFLTTIGDGFAMQYVVSIGYVQTSIPVWISYLYAIFIAFAVFPLRVSGKATLSRWQKTALAALAAFCFLLISVLLYISWTPVGARVIDGMQARYLTPLLILLIPFTAVRSTKKNEQEGSLSANQYRWGTLFFLAASLAMSVYFFYIKH